MPLLFGAEKPKNPARPPGVVDGFLCAEEGCQGRLVCRPSRFGWFYACDRWPDCEGTLPANKDGSPQGKPRRKSLQRARSAAHRAFDPIWQEPLEDGTTRVGRSVAYLWLAEVMGMRREDAHMYLMDEEQCRRVVQMVDEKGPGTEFWDGWWAGLRAGWRSTGGGGSTEGRRKRREGDTECPYCKRLLRGLQGLKAHLRASHHGKWEEGVEVYLRNQAARTRGT